MLQFCSYLQTSLKDSDPLTNNADIANILEANNTLQFYFIDISEDYSTPSDLYLFGKVYNKKTHKYESCSVIVENFQR